MPHKVSVPYVKVLVHLVFRSSNGSYVRLMIIGNITKLIWLRVHANFSNNRNFSSDVKENEDRLRPSDNISLTLISK